MWSVVSILSGLIAGMAVVFLGLMVGMGLHPLPESVTTSNTDAMNAFLATLPNSAFWIKGATHTIACFVGGLVGGLVANKGKVQVASTTVLLLFTLVIFRDFRFNYPSIYVVVDLCSSMVFGFVGVLLGSRGR